jgi:hypothetical protein
MSTLSFKKTLLSRRISYALYLFANKEKNISTRASSAQKLGGGKLKPLALLKHRSMVLRGNVPQQLPQQDLKASGSSLPARRSGSRDQRGEPKDLLRPPESFYSGFQISVWQSSLVLPGPHPALSRRADLYPHILPPCGGGYRCGVKGAIPPPIPTFPNKGGRGGNSGCDRSSKKQDLWVKLSPEGEGV